MTEEREIVERLQEAKWIARSCRFAADDATNSGLPVTASTLREAAAEIERLQKWVDDCQAGMYINCVYCGHRYGPEDEVAATMQKVLYEHIAKCPKHPLSQAMAEIEQLREACRLYRHAIRQPTIYHQDGIKEQADILCGHNPGAEGAP